MCFQIHMRVWCYNGIWLQSFSYHLSSLRRKSCGKEKARTRIKEFGHRDKWLGGVNGLQFRTSMREEAGRWRGKGRGWEDKPFSPFLSLSILAIERGRLSLLRRGEPHFEPVCAFLKDRKEMWCFCLYAYVLFSGSWSSNLISSFYQKPK